MAPIGAIDLCESTPVLVHSCLIHTVKDSWGPNEFVFEAAYDEGVRSRCDVKVCADGDCSHAIDTISADGPCVVRRVTRVVVDSG